MKWNPRQQNKKIWNKLLHSIEILDTRNGLFRFDLLWASSKNWLNSTKKKTIELQKTWRSTFTVSNIFEWFSSSSSCFSFCFVMLCGFVYMMQKLIEFIIEMFESIFNSHFSIHPKANNLNHNDFAHNKYNKIQRIFIVCFAGIFVYAYEKRK